MSNKFLKQYPNLWVPCIGDTIRIIKAFGFDEKETDEWIYKKGDTGTIVKIWTNTILYSVYFKIYEKTYFVYKDEMELINKNHE